MDTFHLRTSGERCIVRPSSEFWQQWRLKLRECSAHLVSLIVWHAGGDAAPVIAFTATEENGYGAETDGRIPQGCGAYRIDLLVSTVADKVLFLSKGRIREHGTPSEILTYPKQDGTKNFLRGHGTFRLPESKID